MMRTRFINIALIGFLISLSSTVRSQTDLQNHTAVINSLIGEEANNFISQMAANMVNGTTTIVDPNTGQQYHVTQGQLDAFNAAYSLALSESTQEHLTSLLIQDQIIGQQVEFEDQKNAMIEEAQQMAAVTAIAAEIEVANESTKIGMEKYATDNDLREIKQDTRDKYAASIEGMVVASRTKNMLEQYSGAIIESTTFVTQATGTVQAFYDSADVSIDDIYTNQLNLAWSGILVGVEDQFWTDNINTEQGFFPDPVAPIYGVEP
jgi:osmotically-inducible protein OsmY